MSRKVHWIIAGCVFLFAFLVYLSTMAATTSFWDCGEFIAVSNILGVPHPPGYPLLTLIGRCAILLFAPLSTEIAWRVNLLSPIFSGLAVMLVFILVTKMIRFFKGEPKDKLEKIAIWAGGIISSVCVVFATTYWDNSVEAEAYAPATFGMLLTFWLVLKWNDIKQTVGAKKLLLLIAFLWGIGFGIHMAILQIAPAIILFLIILDWREFINRDLFGFIARLSVLLLVYDQVLGRLFPWLGAQHEIWTWFFPLLCVAAAFIFDRDGLLRLNFYDYAFGLFMLGISMHAYLLIRANLKPAINECDPKDWQSLLYVLERKQYEPFNFSERRADFWGYQFGYMFLRYFFWQWDVATSRLPLWIGTLWSKLISALGRPPVHSLGEEWIPPGRKIFPDFLGAFLSLSIYFLGFLGSITHYKRDKKTFALLGGAFFLASFILVFYFNMLNPQVRERDYFFAPAFLFFAMWIGMGAWQMIDWVKNSSLYRKSSALGNSLVSMTLIILLILSLLPGFTFFPVKDRSKNWIPSEYGENILESCEPNGIIFTNGDNDTFPLWFVQEAKNIRKDVRVVNLSLLNTNWYLRQLKDAGVPLNLTYEQIENITPIQLQNRQILMVNTIGVRDILAANAGKGKDLKHIFEPSSEFVKNILVGYSGKYPIYFAVTVSEDNLTDVQDYLKMEGMVYRVAPDVWKRQPDMERTRKLMHEVYKYTSVYDNSVFKDENTSRLLANYASGFWQLGMGYRKKGALHAALAEFEQAKKIAPTEPACLNALGMTYAELGNYDEAIENFNEMVKLFPMAPEVYVQLGSVQQAAGKFNEARQSFQKSIELNPHFPESYFRLYTLYRQLNDTASALSVLSTWMKLHPEDTTARDEFARYRKEIENMNRKKSLPESVVGQYKALQLQPGR